MSAISIQVSEKGTKARSYDLDADLSGKMTLQEFFDFTKRAHIKIAKAVLDDAQDNGFDKKPVKAIDNRFNKQEEDVKYFGKIEYISNVEIKPYLIRAYLYIWNLSKVVTGQYRSSNEVYFNGQKVANDPKSFERWLNSNPKFTNKDRLRFVNTAPYANKLELEGVTANGTNKKEGPTKRKNGSLRDKGKLFRKPNGVYIISHRAIKRMLKGNVFVVYQPILGSELGLNSPESGSGIGRKRQLGRDKGRTYVYPSIYIQIAQTGIVQ